MRISDWSSDVCSSDLAEARKNEKLRPVHRPLSRIIVPPDHHKPKLSGVPPTMIIRLSRLHLFAIVVLVLALAATSAWAQDGRGNGRGQGQNQGRGQSEQGARGNRLERMREAPPNRKRVV